MPREQTCDRGAMSVIIESCTRYDQALDYLARQIWVIDIDGLINDPDSYALSLAQ